MVIFYYNKIILNVIIVEIIKNKGKSLMNKKIRLLLIEDNLDRRLEFETCINFHRQFELCGKTGSEYEGIILLEKGITDVVILDLELEEGNGVQLAEKMRNLPIEQPFVVVTTNTCSESILQYLRKELKVDFIFQKTNLSYTPNQVLNIIEKVYKYHNNTDRNLDRLQEKDILKKKILQELQNIGFNTSNIGTEYISEALLLLSENHNNSYQISKTIYPALAKQYNSNSANIEKAIRMSIERVWNSASLLQISKHYPYEVTNKNGRPSNGEFIDNMSLKLFGKN